ncbi:hypothetical protein AMTR_s00095p00067920 [Amborella trichopoda]|uniref:Uncharacterized protein n=1 Tax=Amborella trichopoda TaxID=13333 RepID=W1NP47_AMBTC|nr:hypothetical protein AMTR_s00095p00067920 [Amborella trichopoda]
MYLLSHLCTTRKLCSSLRPSFDPLIVDPLDLVVLEEGDVQVDLKEEEFLLELLEQEVADFNADGPVEPEVQFPELVLVEVDAPSPLNVIRHEDRPLLLKPFRLRFQR